MRQVFTMKLRPGALAEYRRLHGEVWPELEQEIARSGIRGFAIYESDPVLVVVSDVDDEQSWERLWDSPVHRRWGELMEPLLQFGGDGLIDKHDMAEIFRFGAEVAA